MPEVMFKVLCANDTDACDRVKQIMGDFQIDPAAKGPDFDHIGIKKFNSLLDARLRANEITQTAGLDLINIKMRLK